MHAVRVYFAFHIVEQSDNGDHRVERRFKGHFLSGAEGSARLLMTKIHLFSSKCPLFQDRW